MDEHELAWAAGFFDGDGWAALVREKHRRTGQPKAQINQGSLTGVPEVLLRFRDAVGVGRVAGPKVEDGREPLYRWVASSRGDVTRVGSAIGPWLSDQKRAQFAAAVGLTFRAPAIDSFAWAAGLFDAEGCVSLCVHDSHLGYKVIDGAVTQGGTALPQELSRFRAVVDVGKTYGPYTQKGAREPIHRWRCQTLDGVRCVIHLLLPWLGDVKRKQGVRGVEGHGRPADASPRATRMGITQDALRSRPRVRLGTRTRIQEPRRRCPAASERAMPDLRTCAGSRGAWCTKEDRRPVGRRSMNLGANALLVEVRLVDLDVVLPLVGHRVLRKDRAHRTH